MKDNMGIGNSSEFNGLEVAVIGMDGRFPGAKNLDQYWDNLVNHVESIYFFSKEEMEDAGVDPAEFEHPHYIMAKGVLEDIEYFDAVFFGYLPSEAEIMTPQIRIFHECAWTALEDAGYEPDSYDGQIGVFVGAAQDLFWEYLTLQSGKCRDFGVFEAALLFSHDPLGTRLSYKLNLRGPSFTLYSACSTSGVAIHQACQALLGGECHLALAGAVSLSFPPKKGYIFQEGMINSPDGHCRVFNHESTGTVFGDGIGVVILKLLDDALNDRDHVYALIKATALNNDGSRKVGYTAPGTEGQAAVMRSALHTSGVEVESISYLEVHGTGTDMGDTIEAQAMKLAYTTDKKGFCGVGSVKGNIGHLNTAGGMSGFIKTVLALKNQLIPPTLYFERPNPKFDFENSPFYVVTETKAWESTGYPRRAGVNIFGLGGTNFHAILEEAPKLENTAGGREWNLLLLSARTVSALEKVTENLAEYLKKNPSINLSDAAYTLQVGRRIYKQRRMLVTSGVAGAVGALSSPGEISAVDSGKAVTAVTEEKKRPVIFMFSGVGSQYVNMGRDLYENEPVFRQEIDRCFEILRTIPGGDIKDILYPAEEESGDRTQEDPMGHPVSAQLAIFVLEYALARLIMKWGIKPDAMIGYSFGEYVAACMAGVFSLEEGLELVVSRANLIQQTPEGAMLSVPVPVEELKQLMDDDDNVSIAIDNGPATIVGGTREAIDTFEKKMKDRKYICMRVNPSSQTRALHSKEMESILKPFEDLVAQVALQVPGIPYISNVTGKEIIGNDVTHTDYWASHLRETVQFANGIKELVKEPNAIFIEIGPGRDLCALVKRYIEDNPGQRVINLVRHPQQDVSDTAFLLERIGRLWLYGLKIDWMEFYPGEKRRRISLPTYPFERKRYWIEGNPFSSSYIPHISQPESVIRKKADISDWFYIPVWKQSSPIFVKDSQADSHPHGGYLVFTDGEGIGDRLAEEFIAQDREVVRVKIGTDFHLEKEGIYHVNPCQKKDYEKLIAEIGKTREMPRRIVHLWSISPHSPHPSGEEPWTLTKERVARAQDYGFYSLLYLLQALQQEDISDTFQLMVITNNMQAISGESYLCPEQSTVLAAVKVIPQEHPSIQCRSIDIVLPETKPGMGDRHLHRLVEQLLEELSGASPDKITALRDNRRWVQTYEPIKLEAAGEPGKNPKLREGGVYLLTGGLGSIGLVLAKYLAVGVKAKLVLIGRSPFPPRDQWGLWLASHPQTDNVSKRIRKIMEIEERGGKVLAVSADTADEKQMRDVVFQAEHAFGPINGVIHAAGISDERFFSPMAMMEKNLGEIHFQPKMWGLMTLQKVLGHKKLDFFILMSSMSAILGGLAFYPYTAANIFMDSLLQQHNRQSAVPWIGVNWDSWQLDEKTDQHGKLGASIAALVMNSEEGMEAFNRVLSHLKEGRLIHSLGDLQARLDQWINIKDRDKEEPGKETLPFISTRENLSSPYAPPRNPVEKELTEIWQNFFGFDKVGILDDFFELGGDSLKGISIAAKMSKKLNANVSISVIFYKLTIEGIAQHINSTKKYTYNLIRPTEKKDYYVTSIGQKKLFVLNQMEKVGTALNVFSITSAEGKIERGRFEEVFNALIRRQESLRTSFHIRDGEILMKIHETNEIDPPIEYADLQESENQENELQEIIKNFSTPFDLSQPPLLRMKMVKLEKDKHVALFDIHHIIRDDVSSKILFDELRALSKGEELPVLNIQYKDYAQWQPKFMESGEFKKMENYWLERFSGEISLLNMPLDYPRPEIQRFEGAWRPFNIETQLIHKIKKLGEDTGTTLYMILLAALNILLSKYTGQEDITIASPITGRDHEELENIIGLFINLLPMRNFPGSRKTFSEFLSEVKENALAAYENQAHPFANLVEKLGIQKDYSRNPLNDVELIMVYTEASLLEIEGLRFCPYEYNQGTAMVDISLEVTELEGGVSFNLMYCTGLFKRETMERFINSFKEILAIVTENKDILLGNITVSADLGEAKTVFQDDKEDFGF
jgi:acyl transferase domain-containing protein